MRGWMILSITLGSVFGPVCYCFTLLATTSWKHLHKDGHIFLVMTCIKVLHCFVARYRGDILGTLSLFWLIQSFSEIPLRMSLHSMGETIENFRDIFANNKYLRSLEGRVP